MSICSVILIIGLLSTVLIVFAKGIGFKYFLRENFKFKKSYRSSISTLGVEGFGEGFS